MLNNLNEYMSVYLLAVLWCFATHLIHIFGRKLFPKFNKSKSTPSIIFEILLKVLYFSVGLYFFQISVLPFLHDILMKYTNINGGFDGANWGATLGITLALSLPRLKDKLEHLL
jgi:hypothetical protein